jgi:hypothetical protein
MYALIGGMDRAFKKTTWNEDLIRKE